MVGKVRVTGTHELRFVMSYLDKEVSVDSSIPLLTDLDMFVVSPNNRIYFGNQYCSREHEYFSTNERVIVPSDQIQWGEYTIHVYSRDPRNIGATFCIVAVGSFGSETLEMTPASQDLPCRNWGTPTKSHVCKCPAQYTGLLCQIQVSLITEKTPLTKEFLSLESIHFSWNNPDLSKKWYLHVSHPYSKKYEKFARHMIYLGTPGDEVPFDFDSIHTYDLYLTIDITGVTELRAFHLI